MKCKNCQAELVASLEIQVSYCSSCIPSRLRDESAEEERRSKIAHLEATLETFRKNLAMLQEARERRVELDACFEGGKEAFARDFSIDQVPHTEGSDESVMWQNGWIEAARIKEADEMREFIRWDFNLWMHLHELIVNGCDAEELCVKSTLAPIRAMKFLPELLGEDEHKS